MDAETAIDRWQSDGLVTPDLADRLRDRLRFYADQSAPIPPDPVGAPGTAATTGGGDPAGAIESWTVRFVVMLGAVLVGGGLLAFIAAQWDQQSPARRLGLLLLIWALITAGAAALTRRGMVMTGQAFWFMSTLAAGTNIFLIGQVYNLPLTWWMGTALWAICALAMGWATGSPVQGWLAVPLAVLTIAWWVPPRTRWAEQAAYLFEPEGIRALLPILGLVLIVGSRLVERTRFEFARVPAMVVGTLLAAVPFVLSTFHPEMFTELFRIEFTWRHGAILVAAGAAVLAGLRFAPHRLVTGAAVAVAAASILILPQVEVDGYRIKTAPWLGPVFEANAFAFWVWNGLILAAAIGVVVAGRRFEERALVNVGMVAVAVLVLAFYIGRIAGQLPTSLALLGGGFVLVAGGYVLERRRRDLISEVGP